MDSRFKPAALSLGPDTLAGVETSFSPVTNWKDPVEEAEGGRDMLPGPERTADAAASRFNKIEFKELFSSVLLVLGLDIEWNGNESMYKKS